MANFQQIIFRFIFSYGIYNSVKTLYRKGHKIKASFIENNLPSVGFSHRLAATARLQNKVFKYKSPEATE